MSGKMSYCDCAGYLLTNDPKGKHEVTSGDPVLFFLSETLIVICPVSSDTTVLCLDTTPVCCSHRIPRAAVSTGLLSHIVRSSHNVLGMHVCTTMPS